MNGCLGPLLAPLGLFLSHPYLAFLPAALFLLYYFVRRPAAAELGVPGQVRWSVVAGLGWIVYGLYEMRMQQWSRTVMGAIRVDLFLVLPVLYLLTAVAIVSSVTFERAAAKGLDPVKPIRPGPYALLRNRRFVLGLAIAIAAFPILSLLFQLTVLGSRDVVRNVIGILITLALTYFLVQGYRWAKWCLIVWFAYGTLYHLIGWSSLLRVSMRQMAAFQYWHLVSLIIAATLLGYLLFSRRLKEHIDVHSFPETTSISPS